MGEERTGLLVLVCLASLLTLAGAGEGWSGLLPGVRSRFSDPLVTLGMSSVSESKIKSMVSKVLVTFKRSDVVYL